MCLKIVVPLDIIREDHIFKICGHPLKVRGATFFGCINVPKKRGPLDRYDLLF